MAITYKRALEIFRSLGAKEPESLAESEARDGEPALARWLFLQGAWSNVKDDDFVWPGKWANPKAPIPAAIKRMLKAGIDPQDLTDVVRDEQINLLYNLLQLLDSPGHGIEELQSKVTENVEWRLVEYDGDKEKRKRGMGGLHESFHESDPTGRLGEPRPRAKSKSAPKK